MTKTITLILVTLLSVACGGEPFSAAEFDAIGGEPVAGEAGAPDATGGHAVGSAGSTSGGSLSSGGSSSSAGGKATAGATATGGSVTGTAGAGGDAPMACELDVAKLTAALPKNFAWSDFSVAQGNVCAHCTYEPCSQLSTAWGEPSVLGDHVTYKPVYTRTTQVPLMVSVGKNDGICATKVMCDMQPETISVSFSMSLKDDAWVATEISVFVSFVANDCMSGIGKPEELTGPVALDLQAEIKKSVAGLQIPCN